MEIYGIFDGRPKELYVEPTEKMTYDFLDRIGVKYKTMKHTEAYTMEQCEEVRDKLNAPVFKNLFLTNKQQTAFFLLVMPADKVFKTKYLSSQINSARLSFASDEQLKKYLNVCPGSVTPLGLFYDTDKTVKVLLDKDLQNYELFACHPCVNTASVVMDLNVLIEKVIPATSHDFQWVELPNE